MRDLVQFLAYVQGECAHAGVRFRLLPRKRTPAGDLGYFNEVGRVLMVCAFADSWAMLLAHELSHLHQEREKKFVWPTDYVTTFEDWCKGVRKKRLTFRKIRNMARAVACAERDAEKRTLRLAKTYHLEDKAGIVAYTRGANMYLWKHEVALKLGFWPKYADNDTIEATMPTRLIARSKLTKPPAILLEMAQR